VYSVVIVSFSAVTSLVECQEGHAACEDLLHAYPKLILEKIECGVFDGYCHNLLL